MEILEANSTMCMLKVELQEKEITEKLFQKWELKLNQVRFLLLLPEKEEIF
jgi:hypothetical protein